MPLSPAAAQALKADPSLLPVILNGGDDYEILATVRPKSAAAFADAASAVGVPVTRIGTILAGNGPPVVRDRQGRAIELVAGSHTHF